MGQCVYFSSNLDQHCPPNTIDLRCGDRDNPWSLLLVPDEDMSVGDSAEEFISIHALGRERLLVVSGGLPSIPLKIRFFFPLGEFLSQFSAHQPPNVYLTRSLVGACHKSPAVE